MSVAIIIPARYESSRYPGKPLVELTGATGKAMSLIERSWRAAQEVPGVSKVLVATDDDRIAEASRSFGAEVAMTSENCRNGTERCAEVVQNSDESWDIVVNLQGDAPLTPPWFVEGIVEGLKNDPQAAIATPVLRSSGAMVAGLLNDRRNGRVGGTTAVFSADGGALYFSKEVIPYLGRTCAAEEMTPVFHHVGVYAYRPDALMAYPDWPIGPLEELEGLEQLRFLEQGRRVACVEVDARGRKFWELNNPTDVPVIESLLREMGQP